MANILEAYRAGKTNLVLDKEDIKNNGVTPSETLPVFIASDLDLKEYTDDYLYEAEVALRKWLAIKCEDEAWVKNPYAKRYTYGMLMKEIFGREYDPKIDSGRLSTTYMFGHYCSQVKKQYYNRATGQTKNTNCYCFSVKRFKEVKPFGLRLQAEMLKEQGIVPTIHNVRRKKYITRGQARNQRTQANMRIREERSRKAYNEYQRNRAKKERH